MHGNRGNVKRRDWLKSNTHGAVSIIFATAAIPLVMAVGLAVDYSFYVQAQSQLSLAADAGAMHGVRIASNHLINGDSTSVSEDAGVAAAKQWFASQAGPLLDGSVRLLPAVSPMTKIVNYDSTASTFTSVVSYAGIVNTHFGGIFHLVNNFWNIGGSASAVITTNSFIEIGLLMDNSSSMLIGATPDDIKALQSLTVCPPTAVASVTGLGQATSDYSWNYGASVNYTSGNPPAPPMPSTSLALRGSCDPTFTGPTGECPYPQSIKGLPGISSSINQYGYCPTGTGTPTTIQDTSLPPPYALIVDKSTGKTANLPSAPCGFACHSNRTPNDFYTLMRNANPVLKSQGLNPIILRFDVIQAAAAQVVQTLELKEAASQVPNQFSIGVYTFNSAIAQVHPTPSGAIVEADKDLAGALAHIQAIAAPAVQNQPNTNFPGAMAYLASNLKPAGDGSSASAPRKNLFVVTDGLEDYSPTNRLIGQMTSPLNETTCAPLKAMGFTIYVLYTPYYALPNPYYLTSGARAAVEAPITNTSLSIAAGLQACASDPTKYYAATDSASINTALQKMLLSALNSPGRVTQ